MNNNIIKSKESELYDLLRQVLTEGLSPLFRVYAELVRKADPVSLTVTGSIKELAESLGCETSDLIAILRDLEKLNTISLQSIRQSNKDWAIALLIY